MLAALNSLGGKTTFFFLINVIIEEICRAEEHQQVAFYELAQSQVLYGHAHIFLKSSYIIPKTMVPKVTSGTSGHCSKLTGVL